MIHVALVEPEIPWNTGNAGRSCLAAAARLHLVQPLGFSLSEGRLRRAGLDYWKEVDPVLHASFRAFEAAMPALGVPFFFCAGEGTPLYEAEIPEGALFVFGSESVGFHPEVREAHRAKFVRIPMAKGAVRSLNLSTAVGVALFEYRRRHPF